MEKIFSVVDVYISRNFSKYARDRVRTSLQSIVFGVVRVEKNSVVYDICMYFLRRPTRVNMVPQDFNCTVESFIIIRCYFSDVFCSCCRVSSVKIVYLK